ncbi:MULTISPECIES: recombinase family protein [Bacillus]|uniref:recombinase family protein n=1 Tax=Bacillus TaxID=1386 RepID=UPI000CF0E4A4|nr:MULTISPECIES: recombinase family protein [Bacillus]MCM3278758.1 recombinase family protein [Bacillus velezensis]MCM3349741.1 recombinase family protein [Bacillus velezensis]MCV4326325.1 recombinase family protein [Bacillus velezensis]MCX2822331.1 recombinase family protein [Bacillus sp. H1F1]MCX2853751.1 recombinase family protein [Bacillus sp. KeR2]
MISKMFGYIRVSSKDQNENRQITNMLKEGIAERDLFIDKQSGKDFERPAYKTLKQVVRTGDTVVFDSITRMGRNMKETQKEYDWFIDNGIKLKFIKEPMINSTEDQDDILKEAIQKIVLTILTAFAEKEREDIRERQAEGIKDAKEKGKHLGRPKKGFDTLTKEQRSTLESGYSKWKSKEITGVQFAKDLQLTKNTFYKVIKEYEAQLTLAN